MVEHRVARVTDEGERSCRRSAGLKMFMGNLQKNNCLIARLTQFIQEAETVMILEVYRATTS